MLYLVLSQLVDCFDQGLLIGYQIDDRNALFLQDVLDVGDVCDVYDVQRCGLST